jgi:hypothetical protein
MSYEYSTNSFPIFRSSKLSIIAQYIDAAVQWSNIPCNTSIKKSSSISSDNLLKTKEKSDEIVLKKT